RAFGPRPLGWIHPAQAPPGKPTTYCWHVMPFAPDLGGQDDEDFKREFAEKIIATFARYCPNLTRDNIIGQYVYTAKEYTQELINMRGGDIFMGAFNAEQVMYNHLLGRTCTNYVSVLNWILWRAERPNSVSTGCPH